MIVLPNYIADEIDRRLDAAIAEVPAAEDSRDHMRQELINFFAENGTVPEFSIARAQEAHNAD